MFGANGRNCGLCEVLELNWGLDYVGSGYGLFGNKSDIVNGRIDIAVNKNVNYSKNYD